MAIPTNSTTEFNPKSQNSTDFFNIHLCYHLSRITVVKYLNTGRLRGSNLQNMLS